MNDLPNVPCGAWSLSRPHGAHAWQPEPGMRHVRCPGHPCACPNPPLHEAACPATGDLWRGVAPGGTANNPPTSVDRDGCDIGRDHGDPRADCVADMDSELTAVEARALADELGYDLYRAQDALAFVAECCDIADREARPVTTRHVREWLKGARCGRQLVADGVIPGSDGDPDTRCGKPFRTEYHGIASCSRGLGHSGMHHGHADDGAELRWPAAVPDDTDLTEQDIDQMMTDGTPVQIVTGVRCACGQVDTAARVQTGDGHVHLGPPVNPSIKVTIEALAVEDDEDPAAVKAAFEAGEKGLTAPPASLRQQIARALHRYDYEHDLSRNDIPGEHHFGEADAALATLEECLDIGDAEAWCRTCRRVWGGKSHRCESDAEQALARVRALAVDMRTWCSPHGIATDYAQRIDDAINGAGTT